MKYYFNINNTWLTKRIYWFGGGIENSYHDFAIHLAIFGIVFAIGIRKRGHSLTGKAPNS